MTTDHEKQLITAFIQGAKWWEWYQTDFTMWQSDQRYAYEEATKRLKNGTLGIDPVKKAAKGEK